MKKITFRILAAAAMAATLGAGSAPAAAAKPTGPEVAPAGHKWMHCGFNYRGPRYLSGYVQSGPWLVKLSDPLPSNLLRQMGNDFVKEYMANPGRLASEARADAEPVPEHYGCQINERLSDREYYNERIEKDRGYVRTSFRPSFAIEPSAVPGRRDEAADRAPKEVTPADELHLAFPSNKPSDDAGEVPAKRKKTNAEADAEYALKLEQYNREMNAWRDKVDERDRLEAEGKRQHAEAVEKARKAKADWEKAVAACKAGDRIACMGAKEE